MNKTQATTTKQFTQAEINEAASILAIAVSCDDRDLLRRARKVYEPQLLNLAAKRLSPAQHGVIMSWVLASEKIKG